MDNREQFDMWISQWEQAEKELAQEKTVPEPEPQPRTSYFTGTPASADYEDDGESGDNEDWHSLYQRAVEIDYRGNDGLLTDAVNVAYAGNEGYGKQQTSANVKNEDGKKKVYLNNPVHYASVGNDQEGDDGHVRVSKNWSAGPELEELADVKRQVEEMERRFHESDVLKKSDKSKWESELKNLRERVHKLSQKIIPDPQEDFA